MNAAEKWKYLKAWSDTVDARLSKLTAGAKRALDFEEWARWRFDGTAQPEDFCERVKALDAHLRDIDEQLTQECIEGAKARKDMIWLGNEIDALKPKHKRKRPKPKLQRKLKPKRKAIKK